MARSNYWNRKSVEKLASFLGAIVTINPAARLDVGVEAPRGFTWRSDPEIHELIAAQWDDDHTQDVWRDLFERMTMGVEPCAVIDECEWCNTCDCCGEIISKSDVEMYRNHTGERPINCRDWLGVKAMERS